jgi:hypothetical protein
MCTSLCCKLELRNTFDSSPPFDDEEILRVDARVRLFVVQNNRKHHAVSYCLHAAVFERNRTLGQSLR